MEKKLSGNKRRLSHYVYATCTLRSARAWDGDSKNKTLLLIYLIKFHAGTAALSWLWNFREFKCIFVTLDYFFFVLLADVIVVVLSVGSADICWHQTSDSDTLIPGKLIQKTHPTGWLIIRRRRSKQVFSRLVSLKDLNSFPACRWPPESKQFN